MESRPTFKEFYTHEKHLFEIVAFFGVIGSLLLQVQNPPKELRVVQVIFHLLFLLILAWIGCKFLLFVWIAMEKEKENLLDLIQSTWVSQILGIIFAAIIVGYFRYVYANFKDELRSVYQEISVLLYLILIIQFSKIQKFLEPYLGKKHAEAVITVYLYGLLSYAFYYLIPVTRKITQEPFSHLSELFGLLLFTAPVLTFSILSVYFPSLKKRWVCVALLISALIGCVYLHFTDYALIRTSWPMCHY